MIFSFNVLDYLPCSCKIPIETIFGLIYIISEPIFKTFAALFTTFGLQKDDMVMVFQNSEILKNAVSERWCTDSRQNSVNFAYLSLVTIIYK